MKIDNIIFSCSPQFSQFWNVQSMLWKTKMGITPICLAFGDCSSYGSLSEKWGRVFRIEPEKNLSPVLQVTMSKFMFGNMNLDLDMNQTYMIGDIDLIPLQSQYFVDDISQVSVDCYMHMASVEEKDLRGGGRIPAYYHVATGNLFQDLYGRRGFHETVAHVMNDTKHGNREVAPFQNRNAFDGNFRMFYWCAEEDYTTKILRNTGIPLVFRDYIGDHKERYIDRDTWRYRNDGGGWNGSDYVYDAKKLAEGGYVDLHCHRPYHEQEKPMMRILEIAGMLG